VRYSSRVIGVGRKGRDLSVDAGRAEQPFVVHVRRADDTEERLEAKAVVDASGTWRAPSPAGAEGLPALGEQAAVEAGLLDHRTPSREEAAELAGKHIVVVGSGHSAATAIGDLAAVVRREPGTRVTWALRRGTVGNAFGGGSADELPERGALGLRAKKAVEDGYVDLVTGFRVERVLVEDGRAVLVGEDGRRLEPADRVVVATGFRPDLSFLSEVRLDLDVRLQAPTKVATEVDPNLHSCGSVRATGATDLAHPEPGFYIVGAKSYGRAPTFLAMTGYEQVRSVVAELSGDHEAADRVELELPDPGVCGGSGPLEAPEQAAAGGCWTSASPRPVLGVTAAGSRWCSRPVTSRLGRGRATTTACGCSPRAGTAPSRVTRSPATPTGTRAATRSPTTSAATQSGWASRCGPMLASPRSPPTARALPWSWPMGAAWSGMHSSLPRGRSPTPTCR